MLDKVGAGQIPGAVHRERHFFIFECLARKARLVRDAPQQRVDRVLLRNRGLSSAPPSVLNFFDGRLAALCADPFHLACHEALRVPIATPRDLSNDLGPLQINLGSRHSRGDRDLIPRAIQVPLIRRAKEILEFSPFRGSKLEPSRSNTATRGTPRTLLGPLASDDPVLHRDVIARTILRQDAALAIGDRAARGRSLPDSNEPFLRLLTQFSGAKNRQVRQTQRKRDQRERRRAGKQQQPPVVHARNDDV